MAERHEHPAAHTRCRFAAFLDFLYPTRVLGDARRLLPGELGRAWGEATWTAKDMT